ncbi:hypothetical protein HDE_13059 [Halotydeus destructor]|nr:hypothetical protein HDE_13059 [Halotydeus destructor]
MSNLDHEDIKIGVPISGVVLKLHSQLGWKLPERVDLMGSIDRMSWLTFSFFLVVVHIVAAFYCFMKPISPIARYVQLSWHSLRSALVQDNFLARSTTETALYMLISTLTFVLITGYMLNILSTDVVVTKPLRRVESLLDLFDAHFDKVKLYMSKNELFYSYVKSSSKNTSMGKLYEKMRRSNDCRYLATCSFYEINFGQDVSDNLELLSNVSESGNAAMFLSQEMVDHVTLPFVCQTSPKMAERLFTAPQEIAYDTLMSFYRSDLKYSVEKYVKYKLSTMFEFALPWIHIRHMTELFTSSSVSDKDLAYYKCMARDLTIEQSTLVQVELSIYKRPMLILSDIIILSVLLILAELQSRTKVVRRCKRRVARLTTASLAPSIVNMISRIFLRKTRQLSCSSILEANAQDGITTAHA